MSETHALTRVRGVLAATPYETRLTFGRHELVADEPASAGGADAGPTPFALLLSGLIACTAITLRMYAERKAWPLTGLAVDAAYHHDPAGAFIERILIIEGDLDEAQRARMADIAERTPVTLAVKGGVEIRTRVKEAA
jgi:putative redox protein